MNEYPSIDQGATFDTPEEVRMFGEFVVDILVPGWKLMYASPEARARFTEWTGTPEAAHCIHCGRPALDEEGTIAPASWAVTDPTFKPHCATCSRMEAGG